MKAYKLKRSKNIELIVELDNTLGMIRLGFPELSNMSLNKFREYKVFDRIKKTKYVVTVRMPLRNLAPGRYTLLKTNVTQDMLLEMTDKLNRMIKA